jgi:hypothetical protein
VLVVDQDADAMREVRAVVVAITPIRIKVHGPLGAAGIHVSHASIHRSLLGSHICLLSP